MPLLRHDRPELGAKIPHPLPGVQVPEGERYQSFPRPAEVLKKGLGVTIALDHLDGQIRNMELNCWLRR